jgi:hypothetical protein
MPPDPKRSSARAIVKQPLHPDQEIVHRPIAPLRSDSRQSDCGLKLRQPAVRVPSATARARPMRRCRRQTTGELMTRSAAEALQWALRGGGTSRAGRRNHRSGV